MLHDSIPVEQASIDKDKAPGQLWGYSFMARSISVGTLAWAFYNAGCCRSRRGPTYWPGESCENAWREDQDGDKS
jgi:hypothetical protein